MFSSVETEFNHAVEQKKGNEAKLVDSLDGNASANLPDSGVRYS
jgi:hypothetical protein